ncbi:MAG TPA: outer membrane beta-barrel protein, partial [bacterium]|nr:outer membrane beta-barrel protein [bacterium]
FVYGIPHWHTGLGVAYAPIRQVRVAGYVVDGWNNISSFSVGPGAGKTYGLDFGFTPDSTWGFNLKAVVGPSAQDMGTNGSEAKFVGEIILRYNASDKLSFVVDAGYVGQVIPGAKTDALFNRGKDAWFTTLYGRYRFESDWAVALRLEDVDEDQDLLGFYSGINSLGTATDVEAREATLTIEHNFSPNLLVRLEPRLDIALSGGSSYSSSTAPQGPFAGGNGTQFTTTASAVVSF